MKNKQTFGAELEKTIANSKSGLPHLVSQGFFQNLAKEAKKRKTFVGFHEADARKNTNIGVLSTDLGEQGLDNGFNLLETSLPYTFSLEELRKKILFDLSLVQQSLKKEGGSVVNLSNHPLGKRDWEMYAKTVAPKMFYTTLWFRGWDHTAGIDARSQNSPSTGVDIYDVTDAFSVIVGAGAAFIGLFGNGPFEEGKRSAYKESRITMWPRMMRHSKISGDKDTMHFPPKRIRTLAQYFSWIHGGNTAIFFVVGNSHNYKHVGTNILSLPENPSVLTYLSQPSWEAFDIAALVNNFPPKPTIVTPHISHMEMVQFSVFTGARIRYKIKNHDAFPIKEFVKACSFQDRFDVEKIFAKYTDYVYIEGRDPGANFPDAELFEKGKNVAMSTYIAPSAIQAGLLRNLKKAVKYIDSFPWKTIGNLRDAAIKDGLQGNADGVSVYDFTKKIVEIASEALSKDEQNMLAYPYFVLQTKQNGADRAIAFVEKQKGPISERLQMLVKSREIVLPKEAGV